MTSFYPNGAGEGWSIILRLTSDMRNNEPQVSERGEVQI